MKTYNHIMRAVCSIPWAIEQSKLHAIIAFLEYKALTGGAPIDADIRAELMAATSARSVARQSGAVAVLPLVGIISHRMSAMAEVSGPGGASTEKFGRAFSQAVNDPNVKAIVIDVDSPGGTIDGVEELANLIYSARGTKPITAIANSKMASAAYWIGAAADEVVASPSSLVGSIGVYMAHEDISQQMEQEGRKLTIISYGKYKTEANEFEPLTPEAKDHIQKLVNSMGNAFTKSVAKFRGVKVAQVRNGFGEGRVVTAEDAVSLGMADRVGTMDDVLQKYGVSNGTSSMGAASPLPAVAEEHSPAIEAAANSVEQELANTPDPQSIAFDLEMRRRMIEFAD
jgi:signal peptide peptidase SppA